MFELKSSLGNPSLVFFVFEALNISAGPVFRLELRNPGLEVLYLSTDSFFENCVLKEVRFLKLEVLL
jgi:hypothetical protein